MVIIFVLGNRDVQKLFLKEQKKNTMPKFLKHTSSPSPRLESLRLVNKKEVNGPRKGMAALSVGSGIHGPQLKCFKQTASPAIGGMQVIAVRCGGLVLFDRCFPGSRDALACLTVRR